MAYKYSPKESERIFDEMFGKNAFKGGLSNMSDIGRQIGEARLYGKMMEEKRKEEEKERKKKEKEAEKKRKAEEARNKLLGNIPADDKKKDKKLPFTAQAKKNLGEVLETGGKILDIIERPWNALSTGVKQEAEGGSFFKGAKEGITGKKHTSGAEMLKSVGLNPDKSPAMKGILTGIGLGIQASSPAIKGATSKMNKADVGLGTLGLGTEIVADPLNLLGTGLATKGISALGKVGKLGKAAKPMEEILQLPPPKTLELPPPKVEPKVSAKTLEDAGVNFGYSGKNEPKIRPLEPVKEMPMDHLNRSTAYWRTRYEDFAAHVKHNYDQNTLSKEALDEAWTQFARYDEPFTLEQVVDLAHPSGTIGEKKLNIPPRENYSVDPEFAKETVPNRPKRKRTVPEQYKTEPIPTKVKHDPVAERAEWEELRKMWGPKNPKNPLSSQGWNGPPEKLDRYLELKEKYGKSPSEEGLFEGLIHPSTRAEGTPKKTVIEQVFDDILDETMGARPGGGKAGTATPISKAFDVLGDTRKRAPIETPIQKIWNKTSKALLDKTVYVKHIENLLKNIPRFKGEGSLYQKLTNVKGASGASEHYVKQNLIPALDDVEKAGGSRMDALDYVYAHNLKETVAKNPKYTLPKGVTEKDLDDTVAMFQGRQEFEDFRASMQSYWTNLQDELVDAGWLSTEQVEAMRKTYPNYMPKFRAQDLSDPEKFEEAFARLIGGRNTKNPVHRIEHGSDEEIADPIQNIIQATQNMKYAILRNKALQHLEDIADLPLGNGTLAVKRVKAGEKAVNPVKVRFDGKEVIYDVHEELAEAITSVKDVLDLDPVLNMVARAARNQRSLVTANPVFTVRNFIRDVVQGFNVSRNDLDFLIQIPQAFLDIVTGGKRSNSMLKEFFEHGGGNSTVWSTDRNVFESLQRQAYGKEYSKGHKTYENFSKMGKYFEILQDAIRKFNDGAEQIPKLAEFRASVKNGSDFDEAAFNARDIMDFQKSGGTTQKVNKYIAFINANIRGKEKYTRALAERPIPTIMKGVVSSTIPSALAYAAVQTLATDDQKRMIDESPAWLRDTFWLFPDLEGEGLVRIPKPFDSAALFSAPFEYGIRHMEGKGISAEKEILDWIVANVYINPSLNPLTPIGEAVFNKDLFSGSDIIPQREKDLPYNEQRDVYTSSVAGGIADVANKVPVLRQTKAASPRVVDHVLKGLFPGTGETALNSVDRTLEGMGVRDVKKPENTKDSPLDALLNVGRQFSVPAEGNSAYTVMNEMYDQTADLKNIKKKQGDDAFMYPSVYKYMNKVVKMKHEYDGAIREIDNSPDYSPSQKKEARNQLIAQRNALVRNLKEQGFLSSDPEKLAQLEIIAEGLLADME